MKKGLTFGWVIVAMLLVAASRKPSFDPALPILGTKFHPLPESRGKAQVEAACYRCHSSDMLVQQRLTEKQWTSVVEKMIRWGAAVKEPDKKVVIAYLSRHFGPANTKFQPLKTRPVGY